MSCLCLVSRACPCSPALKEISVKSARRTKSICVLLAVGFVAANDLKGVDPNTLSCDPEGQVFLLLPHFTDCNKYYMCAHGKEVEFTCSSTTIFDFELQTCNWNWATKCWLRGEPTIEGSGDDSWTPEEASGSFDIGAAAEDEHKFRPDLKCNVASSASRRVSYKGDCQRYWHCRGADLTVAYCSDGLFFNAQTQQCDHEANVQCKVQQEDELKGEFIVYKK